MLLRGKDLLPLIHGAVDYEETKDGIVFLRFPASFRETLSQSVAYAACGAGISLFFRTDALQLHISFTLKNAVSCDIIPPVMDLQVNGELLFSQPVPTEKDMKNDFIFALGGEGFKTVRVWFPHQAVIAIDLLDLEGATSCVAVKSEKKRILAIADSITQGFYCDAPSLTYFNLLADGLGMEALNQGIGGYTFCPDMVMKADFLPQLILIALGTNDYYNPAKSDIPAFFRAVRGIYPNIPIIAFSPLVRMDSEIPAPRIEDIKNAIMNETHSGNGDRFIDGHTLLPKNEKLFEDGLHPNREGMKLLADCLIEHIREMKILE